MSWQTVERGERLESGARYRSRYYFSFPYSTALANTATGAVFAARGALKLGGIEILSAFTASPEATHQNPGDARPRWMLTVEWRKV